MRLWNKPFKVGHYDKCKVRFLRKKTYMSHLIETLARWHVHGSQIHKSFT